MTNVPVAPLGLEPAPAKAPAAVATKPANATPQVAAPAVAAPATAPEQPETAKAEAAAPQAGPQAETVVAMNVPAPPATASDSIDTVADRISWLRDYRGGDCFYATVTSATDKAIEIEGFGTTVAPFEQMLGAFQAKFRVEPDVSVRLIEPAQCEITNFLHALSATAAKRPKLALDRTSVPNGSAISGTLETRRRPQDQPVADRQQGNGVQPRQARNRARGQGGLQRSDQPWGSRPGCGKDGASDHRRRHRRRRSQGSRILKADSRRPPRFPKILAEIRATGRSSQRRRNISGLADSIAI